MSTDTLQQFIADVSRFDWFYEMSDSHDVWKRGSASEATIVHRANVGGDDFKRHWNEQHAKRYNTPTFCGPYRAPFPEVWPQDATDNTIKPKETQP